MNPDLHHGLLERLGCNVAQKLFDGKGLEKKDEAIQSVIFPVSATVRVWVPRHQDYFAAWISLLQRFSQSDSIRLRHIDIRDKNIG